MQSTELKQLQLIIDRLKEENRSLKAELNLHHRLEEQACLSQKMDALAAFSGRMAHDFNNVLQRLLRYTESILMDKSEDSPDYRNLVEIKSNIQKSSEFTGQLQEIAGTKRQDIVPQNLNAIIRAAEKRCRRALPAAAEFRLDLADDLMDINASPGQCEQLLLNLCRNAGDAIPENGEVKIETRNLMKDNADVRQVLYLPQNNYVRLTVSDNGCGIPFQYLNHIYEPFFTTNEKKNHPGLGLALVYGIVKNHNGFVECDSTEGQGTTFTVYLPALDENQQAVQRTEMLKSSGSGDKRKTILIIDDESTILEITQTILQRHGYTVYTARNGEEGMSLYSKHPVDLVLLDLGLPGIGGLRCMKKLLAADHNANIIIVSGDLANGRIQEAQKMGARAFLAKPFSLAELLNTIVNVFTENRQAKPT